MQSTDLAAATAKNFISGLGKLEGNEGAKSFVEIAYKKINNIELDEEEDLKAAK